jgi:hypothetical protein
MRLTISHTDGEIAIAREYDSRAIAIEEMCKFILQVFPPYFKVKLTKTDAGCNVYILHPKYKRKKLVGYRPSLYYVVSFHS